MANASFVKQLLLSTGLIALTGCSLASVPNYSPMETQTAVELSGSNFTPRTAEEREAILTQDLFAQTAFWSREYDLNPADLEAAINLASTLRRMGNTAKSIEVSQHTRALYPRDVSLMTELGASLIAENKSRDALKIIDSALAQDQRNARLWSLKGAGLDQLEDFANARQHYTRALQIAPNDPSVLANVGLSYALEGDPKTAEIWLRQAANTPGASASVRQNLALVLGLQGKMEEAERYTRQDLDVEQTASNMDYIRSLRGSTAPARTSKPESRRTKYGASTKQTRTYGRDAQRPAPRPASRPAQRSTQPVALNRAPLKPSYAPRQQAAKQQAQSTPMAPRPQARLQKPNYGMRLTMAGDSTAMGGAKTAREAAMAMAREQQSRTKTGFTTRQQMPPAQARTSGRPPVKAQPMSSQTVLSRISKSNQSKRSLAQQQRQQLIQRAEQMRTGQMQTTGQPPANRMNAQQAQRVAQQKAAYQAQQQAAQQANPYGGYPAPYGQNVQQQPVPAQGYGRAPARTRRR